MLSVLFLRGGRAIRCRPRHTPVKLFTVMAATKRKAAAVDISRAKANGDVLPPLKRKVLLRKVSTTAATVNSDVNVDIFGASNAVRASPYASASGDVRQAQLGRSESPLSDVPDVIEQPKKKGRAGAEKRIQNAQEEVSVATDTTSTAAPKKTGRGRRSKQPDVETVRPSTAAQTAKKSATKKSAEYDMGDPEADGGEEADENEVKAALIRPPPVNSDYLPLPWKGRLGYACLNTYLRQSYPPVFSSRTCRIQSILEHRHPLQDPTKPEHPVKNRPDRSKPVDVELGKRYLEAICLANVRDIAKMIRWNDRYHIRFLRLSSEMFPFASHPEYGYRLAPFAAKALAEAGQVIAHCGHRVTTHPGQFTQLGSPRKQVIDNAVRDLSYHDEMLTLLRLPEQQDKDAVMILHMGGIFEGKQETIARFKQNYAGLPQSVKNRLVLENDDMGWSVHGNFVNRPSQYEPKLTLSSQTFFQCARSSTSLSSSTFTTTTSSSTPPSSAKAQRILLTYSRVSRQRGRERGLNKKCTTQSRHQAPSRRSSGANIVRG